MILTGIQMQAKVICWTLFLWHDCFRCEGKLTVPSSWTSWKLSLRWASDKIHCEWTIVYEHHFFFNLSIFTFQQNSMWMYMYENITSFKQSLHFQTDKYLSVSKRLDLSRSLNLTEVQIKTWWEVVKIMTKMCEWPWTQCAETIFLQPDIYQLPFQGSRTGAQNGKSRYWPHENK